MYFSSKVFTLHSVRYFHVNYRPPESHVCRLKHASLSRCKVRISRVDLLTLFQLSIHPRLMFTVILTDHTSDYRNPSGTETSLNARHKITWQPSDAYWRLLGSNLPGNGLFSMYQLYRLSSGFPQFLLQSDWKISDYAKTASVEILQYTRHPIIRCYRVYRIAS
jgi:hypothetical protein